MTHILVIDDDLMICQMVREILERSGHRVSEAQEGRKGLAVHKADPADLVITDMVMPGMEGIETLLELKRRYPALKVIAMSGGGMGKGTDYLTMARKFGATRTLIKPFTIQEITRVVTEVLGEPPGGAAQPAGGPGGS